MKATDVFAAGVVMYILLCGRPPFYAKTDRAVLEKTAMGHYSMLGKDWDFISEDAKDLVRKMLRVNPLERITTTEILDHPWIKQLDEQVENNNNSSMGQMEGELPDDSSVGSRISSSANSSTGGDTLAPIITPNISKTGLSSQSRSLLGGRRTNNSSHSQLNLTYALKHLSGHVKQLRSEKFATNVTKLVSIMQHQGIEKSTLSNLYLIPIVPQTPPNEETSSDRDSNNSPRSTKLSSPKPSLIPSTAPAKDETYDTLFLNPEFRAGFSAVIRDLADNEHGKISLEKFMVVLKLIHLSAAPTPNSHNNIAFGPLIISKFIDRDNDGFITADEIFAAQALILQKSQAFLKVNTIEPVNLSF
jgi:serine/threonine protein kinase